MDPGLRAVISRLPQAPGVYRFRDRHDRVLYIGRATDLRSRVRSYWGDLRGRPHLTHMVPRVARIEAVACASSHEAAWLERSLLLVALPRWNRVPGGQEVEVYLHLTDRALTVEHTHDRRGPSSAADDRWFGPYLGGVRARAAVTGLERVLPYATAGATAGTALAMAEVRGLDPHRRDELRRELIAVLEREPGVVAAVAAALAGRRDRLAAALEFELAAKIQAELAAVEWIASAQRVALLEPTDGDLYGWCDPQLVHFALRAGRIRTWTSTRCTPERGRAVAEATPSPWRDFAREAAELALGLREAAAHGPGGDVENSRTTPT